MPRQRYTTEQLKTESSRPHKQGGRPRKYATKEEKQQAQNASSRRSRQRKKNAERAIVCDDNLAPARPIYQTDEERKAGRQASIQRYVASHIEELRLKAAAYGYRKYHATL
jgi:hypothetical protein